MGKVKRGEAMSLEVVDEGKDGKVSFSSIKEFDLFRQFESIFMKIPEVKRIGNFVSNAICFEKKSMVYLFTDSMLVERVRGKLVIE